MIKIEMDVEVSPQFPSGKSAEYIWMLGQPWPVSAEEDSKVQRIEAFGAELEAIGPKFSGGQRLENLDGLVICRTWYLETARYVSGQMRVFYP
jgi:hypothetical protein